MENIFLVGVIPGPTEPSHGEINHLLRPLITDLVEAWEHGFYLSRTAGHPHGRRIRCAVVPIIADLPAARQLAGIGSFRSTDWCSECHQKIQDRDNLDKSTWTPRDYETHRDQVNAWKNAPTEGAREKLYDKNHVRHSEFLRLPYWDPTKFVTVDSMHGFYLGLFRRHVRIIWAWM
ncbi:hypothetical protein BDZ89DRAFT_966086 [Hymenopellis radicata]|nr:hypothetical protein BDZ89DRAFT_966086 [Hymenopellis radicata]